MDGERNLLKSVGNLLEICDEFSLSIFSFSFNTFLLLPFHLPFHIMDIGWSVSLAASFLVYRLFEAFDVVDLILVGLEQWRLKVENATESAMVCERLQGSFVRLKWTSPLAKHFYKAELNQTLYFSISAVSVFLFHKLLSLVKTSLASTTAPETSAANSSYNSSLWFIIALVILSVRLSQLLMHSTKQARELYVCLLVGLVSFLVSAK